MDGGRESGEGCKRVGLWWMGGMGGMSCGTGVLLCIVALEIGIR